MNRFALVGIVSKPVKSSFSHNGGWTMTLKSILEDKFKMEIPIISEKDDWSEFDTLFVTEGVNFKPGGFNFFGGVQQPQIDRLRMLSEYNGRVISLSGELDYNIVMNKRKELVDYDFKFDVPKSLDLLKVSDKLVLGDSHSISVFKKGHTISRNDGKTLRGLDMRFHIFNPRREGTYEDKCKELISRLETQLLDLNLQKTTCVKLIPIENESRKLPGTGKLDGLNFYGSFEQRQEAVNFYNNELESMCKNNGFDILSWDFDYNVELDFKNMEARQSVHLRPDAYMDYTNKNELKLF